MKPAQQTITNQLAIINIPEPVTQCYHIPEPVTQCYRNLSLACLLIRKLQAKRFDRSFFTECEGLREEEPHCFRA